ncbi:MAG TPA: Gfo/Idh/MocA family oxidoreductase [Polyangiaceae bacterium]|nr:Gfo/Idh/MocA family oxidoreductase [Polyangiaceae bacterium]
MRETRRVRYAVVGLGNIAQVAVLPAFAHARKNSELAALISSDSEKLAVLAKRYRVAVTGSYDDLERIIAEHAIDAVYVAVPNSLHREFTERAARAGAHVLCEKPMAMNEADCDAMIRAAAENDVKLMIAYRLHFERANVRAVERIAEGRIGEPRIFSSVFSHQVKPGNIRTKREAGGGALFDLGIYCLNAARYLFRDEPTDVYAEQVFGTDERSEQVDEATTAVLRFPGNRIAQFTASQGASDVSEFRVVGTKGNVELDPAFDYVEELEETLTVGDRKKRRTESKGDQFAPEILHFSKCILEDLEPEPSGWQGLADVRILNALVASAESGRRVEVTPIAMPDRPRKGITNKKPPVGRVRTVNAPSPSR